MPLWQVFHPKGAYTAEDKQGLAERITGLFTSAPMPAFYVVVVFIEMSPDDFYVGAKPTKNFVRFKVDQMANTLPSQLAREWWLRHVQHAVAPYVSDRGYDSEVLSRGLELCEAARLQYLRDLEPFFHFFEQIRLGSQALRHDTIFALGDQGRFAQHAPLRLQCTQLRLGAMHFAHGRDFPSAAGAFAESSRKPAD